jgi:predicted nucleic acid-binding protein
MLVVADTSPLNYLILVDAVQVLERMYGRVIVPGAVARELSAEGAPAKTKEWFARRPGWLEVRIAAAPSDYPGLDAGEAEAIGLAKELRADLLLVDERRATAIARDRENLATTGTLGVLLDAATLGLVDLAGTLARLRSETTFLAPDGLYRQVLAEYGRRGLEIRWSSIGGRVVSGRR